MATLNKRLRRGLLIAATAILALSLAACGQKKNEDHNIAEYKGGSITDNQFTTFTNVLKVINPQLAPYLGSAQYKNMLLEQYIGYQLVYNDASDAIKDKAKKDADAEYATIEKTATKAKLEKELKDSNVTPDDVKKFISLSIGVIRGDELQGDGRGDRQVFCGEQGQLEKGERTPHPGRFQGC